VNKRKMKMIGVAIVILMFLIIIRYVSSSITSIKKYKDLKSEVVEIVVNLSEEESKSTEVLETQETTKETEPEFREPILESKKEIVEETTLEQISVPEEKSKLCSLSDYNGYTPTLNVDYAKLKTINSDYRGWLNITDSNISYPIPQGMDNEYYLHKLFETQQYEYAGSLYIDAYSTKYENQDNLIIYGHNMKNGTMFGSLKKFKDRKYFTDHPYIEFYTKNESRVYLIFSVRTVKSDITSLDYQLDSFDLQTYIDKAVAESEQSRVIDINTNGFESNPYSQIITLSTCVGDTSKRLIVNGLRIK